MNRIAGTVRRYIPGGFFLPHGTAGPRRDRNGAAESRQTPAREKYCGLPQRREAERKESRERQSNDFSRASK